MSATCLLLAMLSAPCAAWAAGPAGGEEPIGSVALAVAMLLLIAKAGGEAAVRCGQPAVIGELAAGIGLGHLGFAGVTWFEGLKTDPSVNLLAGLGTLILLFEMGLESTVTQMVRLGASTAYVAVIGAGAAFGLGWLTGVWLLPDAGGLVHVYLGGCLMATGVVVLARIFKDTGTLDTDEARIVIGAGSIDGLLGVAALASIGAAVSAANRGTEASYGELGAILGQAGLFLAGAFLLGQFVSPRLFGIGSRLHTKGVLLSFGLSFCFLLAWLSSKLGLTAIVGAFAAGLVLEEVHYRDFVERGEHSLRDLIEPISSFLVPIFFVLMGMRTDLRVFAEPGALGLATALTVAAVLGKLLGGLGVVSPGVDPLVVGLGMVPRGAVGLVFADFGRHLMLGGKPLASAPVLSAVVAMIVVTTMAGPLALDWAFARARRRALQPPAG
jgi:Kef-type K+ transport system membrane component KefB